MTWSYVAPPPDRIAAAAVEAQTFSVVIAAHDAAATLADALDSALSQVPPPLEVIVCDDGSTDATPDVLAGYESRVRTIRQTNAGEGAAKNAAAAAAKGDFVCFLDADDVFLPGRLAALTELAHQRPDLGILTTDASIEVDGRHVRRCYDDEWPFPAERQRAAILERNFVFGLAAVRRPTFVEAGGFAEDIRYAVDWDLWIRLILDGAKVGLVDAVLARYRLRAESLSAARPALLAGRAQVLERTADDRRLHEGERTAVRAHARRERAAALLARAADALADRTPGRRRLAAAVARSDAYPRATRARALASAVVPGIAGALLRRERRLHGRPGPAGVRLPG